MDDWIGKRVEIPVHYDMWMRGARFGIVVGVHSTYAKVRMDHPQVKKLLKVWKLDWDYMEVMS